MKENLILITKRTNDSIAVTDLSSWCLEIVTVTAAKASALAKKTMFHIQIFPVAVTNVKKPMHLLVIMKMMMMMM